jgi:hypothetical protein
LTLQGYGWAVDINGTVRANKIGADETVTWPLSFWMGGFDGDALCAYVSGYLSVPVTGAVATADDEAAPKASAAQSTRPARPHGRRKTRDKR